MWEYRFIAIFMRYSYILWCIFLSYLIFKHKIMKTLKDLAVKHDYYCHESNYYSNEASFHYNTWGGFFEEWNDADIDMNLCFRWDISPKDDSNIEKGYYMQVFIMGYIP